LIVLRNSKNYPIIVRNNEGVNDHIEPKATIALKIRKIEDLSESYRKKIERGILVVVDYEPQVKITPVKTPVHKDTVEQKSLKDIASFVTPDFEAVPKESKVKADYKPKPKTAKPAGSKPSTPAKKPGRPKKTIDEGYGK
jgi:hypothetical protein